MPWESRTKHFSEQDMLSLESRKPVALAGAFLNLPPLMVLRAVVEVLLNRDRIKLFDLLKDDKLTKHWQDTELDPEMTDKDRRYLSKLLNEHKQVVDRVAKGIWPSKTSRWSDAEMVMFEDYANDPLLPVMLRQLDPLPTLRALAEYMANGSDDVIIRLLKDEQLNTHWQKYDKNLGVTLRDRRYAFQLYRKLRKLN
jgi:hypothetical protein